MCHGGIKSGGRRGACAGTYNVPPGQSLNVGDGLSQGTGYVLQTRSGVGMVCGGGDQVVSLPGWP